MNEEDHRSYVQCFQDALANLMLTREQREEKNRQIPKPVLARQTNNNFLTTGHYTPPSTPRSK